MLDVIFEVPEHIRPDAFEDFASIDFEGTPMSWNEQGSEPDLTRRESEVLELVANGLSAKEVAHEIGIAPRTVERHIENVRMKMRARNRAHMVAQAVISGVLDLGAPAGSRVCQGCLFHPDVAPGPHSVKS